MSIDIDQFETPETEDYQRANGAPMVLIDGQRKRLSRTSNYGKGLDDESALTNWRIDTAAFGVAHDKTLVARYIACKRDDRSTVKELREASIQAGRGGEAAAIGTAIHAMSERWEQEEDFDPPEPYRSALTAYSGEMDRLGLVSALFEFKTVCVEYGTAGTSDRLYVLTKPLVTPNGEILPIHTMIIGDIKTSKSLEYSKGAFACQLALYAQGQQYDVKTDEFIDTPDINQDWGVIAWIPSNQEQGHCEFIWVDLEAGNQVAFLASEVKAYRKKWRQYEMVTVPDPANRGQDILDAADAVRNMVEKEFGAEEIDIIPFIKARVSAIRDNPDAFSALLFAWPPDVPTPKKGLSSPDDIEKVLDALDLIEAKFGLPFPVDDPRSTPGAHSSDGPVSNRSPKAEAEVSNNHG